MKRYLFLVLLSASVVANAQNRTAELRQELIDAFDMSEKYSLKICDQMPAEFYQFKATDSVMTFAEQWRHCVIFSINQLAGRTGVVNPLKERKLPKVMNKEQVVSEVKAMYAFIRKTVQELPEAKLYEKTGFTNGEISMWRLIYAVENHIIHHRGQVIVYLRLKNIVPEGYVGW